MLSVEDEKQNALNLNTRTLYLFLLSQIIKLIIFDKFCRQTIFLSQVFVDKTFLKTNHLLTNFCRQTFATNFCRPKTFVDQLLPTKNYCRQNYGYTPFRQNTFVDKNSCRQRLFVDKLLLPLKRAQKAPKCSPK